MESPPKRVTRARAAAKATTDNGPKTTKIVTAASKARSVPVVTTKSTLAKRKARAVETDDEDDFAQDHVPTTRTTSAAARVRSRKLGDLEQPSREAAATTKTTRARPVKKPATEAARAQAAAPTTAASATRSRLRRNPDAESDKTVPEPTRKTTRARSGTTTTTTKPAVKKSVKFEEPDKENMAPQDSKKETGAASMRGRPARRGGATAARSTRKTTKTSGSGEKKPLSPRKVTQMPMQRDDESEDELAGANHSPVRPMKQSPVKPPSETKPQAREDDSDGEERDDDNTLVVNNAILNAPDLGSTALGSPARRAPSSVFKDSMKSPARKMGAIPFPGSAMRSAGKPTGFDGQASTSKSSLLMSAAKRPPSPIKGLTLGSPSKGQTPSTTAFKSSMLQSPAKRAMPGLKPLMESPRKQESLTASGTPVMKPLAMSTPNEDVEMTPSEKLLLDNDLSEHVEEAQEEEIFQEPIAKIKFPGRLSAVMPREVDPSSLEEDDMAVDEIQTQGLLDEVETSVEDTALETVGFTAEEHAVATAAVPEEEGGIGEVAAEVEIAANEIVVALPLDATDLSSQEATPGPQDPKYQLREKDLDPCVDMDESDMSLLSPSKTSAGTPTTTLFKAGNRRSTIGLTALAEQFGSWSTASPVKETTDQEKQSVVADAVQSTPALPAQTPGTSHFFEDEMQTRLESPIKANRATPAEEATDEEDMFGEGIPLEEQDLDLAQEAEELAKSTPQKLEEPIQNQSQDDSLSDASQEYGDENEIPIDPAILGNSVAAPSTPVHPRQHALPNTTTKVPLKPADMTTPSPLKKGSFSVSRLSHQPTSGGLTKSVSAPVLSPSKIRKSSSKRRRTSGGAPSTPNKPTDPSSAVYTPGTREDLNPRLLRGAVVYVDVHTTEGADASGIFMELLTQMGARCRKTWDWNPRASSNGDGSNKVGITHIVYKDGGKRTLEKVRQTNGLVHCVGVSWVLDCERENEWLDEAPYYIDTAHVPRGGGRRRKSMEPKALANMNGTVVDSNARGGASLDVQTPASSRERRRESTVWMHTPSDQGDEQNDDIEWSQFILTPVPKTPAPEAIAKYAAEIPETPSAGDLSTASPTKESLLMRTCPPKQIPIQDMGEGLNNTSDRDEKLMTRLLAARRKSLQFAPKIASPLSKAWK